MTASEPSNDADVPPRARIDLVDRTTDAILHFDHDWNLVLANAAAREITTRLTGRAPEEYLGRNFWESFPELVGSRFEEEYRRAVRDEVEVRFEEEIAGLALWVDVRAFPGPDGLSVFYRDVTERKKRELALLEARRHLQQLLTLSPSVIYQIDVRDHDVTPTWVSPNLPRLVGHAPEEALEPGWWEEHLHPEDRERAIERSRAVRSEGRVVHTYRFRTAGGDYRWIRDELRRVETEVGTQIVGSWTDETERVLAEQERERLEVRAARVLDRALDVIALSAPDGTLRYLNPAIRDSLGYAPDELVGRNIMELVHPADLGSVEEAFSRVIRHGPEGGVFEVRLRSRSDGYRVHQVRTSTLQRPGGTGEELLFSSRDVTAERELQSALRRDEWLFYTVLDMVQSAAVALLGPGGIVLSWNRGGERLLGWQAGELTGSSFGRLLADPDGAPSLADLLQRADAEGAAEAEALHQHHDGSTVPARLELRAIRDEREQLLGYCVVSTPLPPPD